MLALDSTAKKSLKKQVSRRRTEMVKQVKKWLAKIKCQNLDWLMVGSGSLKFTANQIEVTEILVGSAYYEHYFDYGQHGGISSISRVCTARHSPARKWRDYLSWRWIRCVRSIGHRQIAVVLSARLKNFTR